MGSRTTIDEQSTVVDDGVEESPKPSLRPTKPSHRPLSSRPRTGKGPTTPGIRRPTPGLGRRGLSTPRGEGLRRRFGEQGTAPPRAERVAEPTTPQVIELPPVMTVKELANSLGLGAVDVIKELMKNGVMASINQEIDYDTAAIVAGELGRETREQAPPVVEQLVEELQPEAGPPEDPALLKPRPPVVTVMGHVDHGKTSLLDAIRKTNVTGSEAGGITQHIGAYQVETHGQRITFLDTPGHAAFTAMRARGARVTDVAVLVVAADDGVMPQTQEAIDHARAAKVPIVVAMNKIDKANANPDRLMQQLADASLLCEQWGGDIPCVPVSAKRGDGIQDLLDVILLVAEMAELKANPDKPAVGTIIEAELDRNRGPVATVLVQGGTLWLKDNVVAGEVSGKVRAMFNDKGKRVKKAEPGTAVEILGLVGVPAAGDVLQVAPDERTAKVVVEQRQRQRRYEAAAAARTVSLDDLFAQIKAGKVKELNIIVRADVQGSLEAIRHSLEKLSEGEVKVNIIHQGTGSITESDVSLAVASKAIIIGFNSRPDPAAKRLSEAEKVDIRFYQVIYNLVEDVQAALAGLLEPKWAEVTEGYAEVRATFKVGKTEVAAGCYVTEGKITRNSLVRVLRGGVVLFDGRLASLRRFKEDVREVSSGYECGLQVEGFNDFQIGDTIEAYRKEQEKA